MKPVKIMLLAALMLMVVGSVARAATPIEFTFSGVYTQTTGTVHTVGQPFTSVVVFDPATPDVNSSPAFGGYRYLSWTVPSPFATPYFFQNPPVTNARIKIAAEGDPTATHTWVIEFQGASLFWSLQVDFPGGTFLSDALPPTLDLSQSISTRFQGSDTDVNLVGTVNSLTVRVVPEPTVGVAVLTVCCLCVRRRQ